ncbi:MAG TPA: hypothetical protein VGF69_10220 [Thermoanaerobaculia bacterium]|jgi:hypothetical protein
MKTRDIYLLVATVIVAAGCRGNSSDTLNRGQQQYEVVQEGAASGVSSTINGPGELTAPAMTGTNADTTTDFNLPTTIPSTPGAPQQAGTIAGSLPPDYSGGGSMGEAPRTPPRPVAQQPSAPRPVQQSQPAYQPPPRQASQPVQPAQPQPSEPAAEPAPTAGPSDTAEPVEPQPPAQQSEPAKPQEKKEKPADEPKDAPPATETAPSEPPAPPPQR